MSVAGGQLKKLRAALLDNRHMAHYGRTVEVILMNGKQQDRTLFLKIPSHAGTTEQLYTSSPGDKAVRQTTINLSKSIVTHSNEKKSHFAT